MNAKPVILIAYFLALHSVFANAGTALDKLDWIDGHWCSDGNGERIEEIWLPSHGGVMLGMSRTLAGERTSSFEYMRIVLGEHGPAYIAQPGGRPPVSFLRSDGGTNWVRFENPEHDFPQRIEYRREGNTLHAKIAGPGEDGKEFEIPFEYVPC
jgi:hypothetical protein